MTYKRWLVTGLTLAILLNAIFLLLLVIDMQSDDKGQDVLREDLRQVSHILSVMQSDKGKELDLLSRVKHSTSKFEQLEEFEIVEFRVYPTKDTSTFTVATKRKGKMFRESIQLVDGKVAGWSAIE
jgi:hypothetical protein